MVSIKASVLARVGFVRVVVGAVDIVVVCAVDIVSVVVTASVIFGRSITQGTMIAISRITPSPIPTPIFN